MSITLDDFQRAQENLKRIIHKTPLLHSRPLSEQANNNIYLKLENLQVTGSFKVRGAYNKITNLTDEQKTKGVVTHSAGNHGIGTAYAASLSGVDATVVLPETPNPVKKQKIEEYGATTIDHGKNSSEMFEKVLEYADKGSSIIHPFDDPYTIAGQGTVGLEILDALPYVDVIVVPVSGGGLISGIATAVKLSKPEVKVIGVNAEGAQAMSRSLAVGKPVEVDDINTIADGLMASKPGDLNFKYTQKYVDDLVIVPEEDIAKTVRIMSDDTKVVAEPSGAAALAAVLHGLINEKGKNVVTIVSGGNIDPSFYVDLLSKENK